MTRRADNWPETCIAAASATRFMRGQVKAALSDPVGWVRGLASTPGADLVEDLAQLAAGGARPGITTVRATSTPDLAQLNVSLLNSKAFLRCSLELEGAAWRIHELEVCEA